MRKYIQHAPTKTKLTTPACQHISALCLLSVYLYLYPQQTACHNKSGVSRRGNKLLIAHADAHHSDNTTTTRTCVWKRTKSSPTRKTGIARRTVRQHQLVQFFHGQLSTLTPLTNGTFPIGATSITDQHGRKGIRCYLQGIDNRGPVLLLPWTTASNRSTVLHGSQTARCYKLPLESVTSF